jgi:hypothetical protein
MRVVLSSLAVALMVGVAPVGAQQQKPPQAPAKPAVAAAAAKQMPDSAKAKAKMAGDSVKMKGKHRSKKHKGEAKKPAN